MTSNAQLAHIWAQQEKPRRTSGNMFFEGPTLYSYGHHFKAGNIIKDNAGKSVALINCQRYSVSTARHVSLAASAVDGLMPWFRVPDLSPHDKAAHRGNLSYIDKELDADVSRVLKGRTSKRYLAEHLRSEIAKRELYSQLFKLGARAYKIDWPAIDAALAKQDKYEAETEARETANTFKHRRNDVAKVVEAIDRFGLGQANKPLSDADVLNIWRTGVMADYVPTAEVIIWALENRNNPEPLKFEGELNRLSRSWGAPALLRLKSGSTDTVITTKGAEFPVSHAHRAYKLWARVQGKTPPEGWQRDSNSTEGLVGHFKIDRIEENGDIVAGCHLIEAAEVKAFGAFMKWEA